MGDETYTDDELLSPEAAELIQDAENDDIDFETFVSQAENMLAAGELEKFRAVAEYTRLVRKYARQEQLREERTERQKIKNRRKGKVAKASRKRNR